MDVMVDNGLLLCGVREVRFLELPLDLPWSDSDEGGLKRYLNIPEMSGEIITSLPELKSNDFTHVDARSGTYYVEQIISGLKDAVSFILLQKQSTCMT